MRITTIKSICKHALTGRQFDVNSKSYFPLIPKKHWNGFLDKIDMLSASKFNRMEFSGMFISMLT